MVASPQFHEQYARTRRFTVGQPTNITVTPDGEAVLFLRSDRDNPIQNLYEFDTAKGEEHLLLTAEQILGAVEEVLSEEEKARRERMRLSAKGIASYKLSEDGARIIVPLGGRLFVIERRTGQVIELPSEHGYPIDPRFSPDGRFVSCVRGGELFITEIATKRETQLTSGAGSLIENGLAEFVAQEEMGRFEGYWWSPDSRMIAFQRTDNSGVETLYIADPTNPEREPQARPYPRPGKKNADVRLAVVSIDGGEPQWVDWDRERYPYLGKVRWDERAPLTFLVQNREQTEEALIALDWAVTGRTRILLVEKDEAWLEIDPRMPRWLADGSGFLWITERNGATQLELRDPVGNLVEAVTPLDFILREFVHLEPDGKSVIVLGGDDPKQSQVIRVAISSRPDPMVHLTREAGVHDAVFAKSGATYVIKSGPAGGSPVNIVYDRQGKEIGRLRSVGEEPPFSPNIEWTTVGEVPQFHAMLVRPRDFRPREKYPVIVSVYGGPHSQMVSMAPRAGLLNQWFADHGFIVVSIDGRGTLYRDRAWERVIKGNFIDIPLEDQVAGLRALGRKYPELDLSRVGIYGWSFGGYFSAMAVMRRPDVFHAGVAGAPVCDWLDYDTHYTERYLGLPEKNEAGYTASSVLTYCPKLERPLLIMHGTADDNVYFTHALKMSDALFRAGRDHEFLPLSDFTHMVADPNINVRLYSRIIRFFEEHLGTSR